MDLQAKAGNSESFVGSNVSTETNNTTTLDFDILLSELSDCKNECRVMKKSFEKSMSENESIFDIRRKSPEVKAVIVADCTNAIRDITNTVHSLNKSIKEAKNMRDELSEQINVISRKCGSDNLDISSNNIDVSSECAENYYSNIRKTISYAIETAEKAINETEFLKYESMNKGELFELKTKAHTNGDNSLKFSPMHTNWPNILMRQSSLNFILSNLDISITAGDISGRNLSKSLEHIQKKLSDAPPCSFDTERDFRTQIKTQKDRIYDSSMAFSEFLELSYEQKTLVCILDFSTSEAKTAIDAEEFFQSTHSQDFHTKKMYNNHINVSQDSFFQIRKFVATGNSLFQKYMIRSKNEASKFPFSCTFFHCTTRLSCGLSNSYLGEMPLPYDGKGYLANPSLRQHDFARPPASSTKTESIEEDIKSTTDSQKSKSIFGFLFPKKTTNSDSYRYQSKATPSLSTIEKEKKNEDAVADMLCMDSSEVE